MPTDMHQGRRENFGCHYQSFQQFWQIGRHTNTQFLMLILAQHWTNGGHQTTSTTSVPHWQASRSPQLWALWLSTRRSRQLVNSQIKSNHMDELEFQHCYLKAIELGLCHQIACHLQLLFPKHDHTCHIKSRRSEKQLTSLLIQFSCLSLRDLLCTSLPVQSPHRMSQPLCILPRPSLPICIPQRFLTSSLDHMPQPILFHPD